MLYRESLPEELLPGKEIAGLPKLAALCCFSAWHALILMLGEKVGNQGCVQQITAPWWQHSGALPCPRQGSGQEWSRIAHPIQDGGEGTSLLFPWHSCGASKLDGVT